MALIDRVKERTGAGLPDSELQAMIDSITAEIDARFGPAGAVTVEIGDVTDPCSRDLRTLRLNRPLDSSQPISIVEIDPGWSGNAANTVTLAANDYRVMHGGRTLARLWDGDNGQQHWAPLVRITYTPKEAPGVRDEAVIRLMQVDLSDKGGLKSERAGDYSYTLTTGVERTDAREAVFSWLNGLLGAGGMSMA
ncbi:hypothetical protein CN157_05065 [Sinorhizobium meliloti]|uniref:hypothetical protein n=1 Tax=Rhizobium meliloti TaxID=382 RepID=UPI000FDC7799|nr:hypothetical protein [Sinorhizobium meliloti]RVK81390.1 hypothetical protein CN157_05065 [Sinorhizobium meliloti]RVQ78012.1 hypothetical protein CN061_06970 [Sinorhizobium meliloti]